MFFPPIVISPSSISQYLEISLTIVDLPDQDGPTMAVKEFSAISKFIFSKTVFSSS